ncbi:MAG: ribonuclease III [Clostridia bacterium]|nr:ribonuclease III [Clostridia bacterium]
MENLKILEQKLNHTFSDTALLTKSLTHSSYTNEMKSRGVICECNERLEFLGDSVLQILSSELLYGRFNTLHEGDLSRIRAQIVCEKALNKYATELGLGEYLLLGHGEELNNGRKRPSILADAFEALIAAIYLDAGLEKTREFLLPFLRAEIETIETGKHGEDSKSRLQEIVQREPNERFEYVIVKESGPAHDREFEVEARLNRNVIGRGKGKTKREAEQNAATQALKLFGEL